jgi:tripartite-type tricarboxylate transporter receptor subunit TctC
MKRWMIAACAALTLGTAQAQEYPNRPIRLLIGFPVGGLLDTISRIVGAGMGTLLGQPMVIEARPGGGGVIATGTLAKAAPDGYTLMMINDNHSLNPSILKDIPYDSVKDFAPVGFVGSAPLVFNSHPGLGLKSMKELVELAKAKDGALTYGSVGPGSLPHLTTEIFTRTAGVKMNHVPYKGGAPAMIDLLAGHINTMMSTVVITRKHIEAGKITALAVASKERVAVLPNVPTMAEAGYPVEAAYWFGLMAPAGTPPAVMARLEKALLEALAQPETRKRLDETGTIVTPLNGRDFGAFIRAETVKWGDAVKKANIKIE